MSEGRRERGRVEGREGRSGFERGLAMHVRTKGRKREREWRSERGV